jgi:TIR domain-containing protein
LADIFLSYARKDKASAQIVAAGLFAHGWTVWWDRKIPPGLTFVEVITRELATCRCVVVLWSGSSVASHWVRNEAAEAHDRGILVPVFIEKVASPFEFRHVHAADLTGWDGMSPTLKKRRNLDTLSTDGEAAPLTGRPAASSG